MPELRLAKLPNRTLVKCTVFLPPDLEQKLRLYAELYEQAYGSQELIETLIPFMLENFLSGDRALNKARKGGQNALTKGSQKASVNGSETGAPRSVESR